MSDVDSANNDTILAQLSAISAKVDASRAEGEVRGQKFSKELELLRGEVHSLTGRVTGTEKAIAEIREKPTEPSQADLERAAELGSAMGEILKVKGQLDAQDRVQQGVVAALGLNYEELAKEGESGTKLALPKVTLNTLSNGQKFTAAATILILVLELLLKTLH